MSRFRGKKKRRFGSSSEKKAPALQIVKDEKRVAICTPSDDHVHVMYCSSLARLIQKTIMDQPPGLTQMSYLNFGSSILPFSRQMIAKVAIEKDCTHTLWIDSDMAFPPDMLCRFLKYDYPIVGINAMARRQPYRNTAQIAPRQQLHTTPDSTGLEKVYRTGFGVIWIATEVFKAIEPPWFNFEYHPETGAFRGEDYVFHEKARAKGYEFYIDHDISKEVIHMGSFGFNPLMAERMQAQAADTTAA